VTASSAELILSSCALVGQRAVCIHNPLSSSSQGWISCYYLHHTLFSNKFSFLWREIIDVHWKFAIMRGLGPKSKCFSSGTSLNIFCYVSVYVLKRSTNSENCHSVLSMELSVRWNFLSALFNKHYSEASCYWFSLEYL